MDLILPYGSVVLAIIALFVLVVLVTLGLRAYLKSKSKEDLAEKYKDKKWASPLTAYNKYPDVNGFRFSGPLLKFGAVIALAATLFSFSATQFEKEVYIPEDALEYEEIEQAPPRTAEPPPPPPPPPPPVIEEVPEEELLEEDEPEFVDQDIEEEEVVEEVEEVEEEAPPPPPPPPPPPAPEEEEVFVIVEQNPRFPGCENEGSKAEKEACAKKKMLEYIYGNLKYPAIARENGIEGSVVIQFVVNKQGRIDDITLARGIGAGCDEAALKVVKGMNKLPKGWTPGKQRGKAVKVKYTLPIRFKLEG